MSQLFPILQQCFVHNLHSNVFFLTDWPPDQLRNHKTKPTTAFTEDAAKVQLN